MATQPTAAGTTGPVRTCVGCRQRAAKSEFLRVTAGPGPDGRPVVTPDPAGTAPGRGAHLHPTTACLDLAVRRRAFGRALRTDTAPDHRPLEEFLARTTPAPSALPASLAPPSDPPTDQGNRSTGS